LEKNEKKHKWNARSLSKAIEKGNEQSIQNDVNSDKKKLKEQSEKTIYFGHKSV